MALNSQMLSNRSWRLGDLVPVVWKCSLCTVSHQFKVDHVKHFDEIPLASKQSTRKIFKGLLGLGGDISARILTRQLEMFKEFGPIVRLQVPLAKEEQLLIFTPADTAIVYRQADRNKNHAHRSVHPILKMVLDQHKKQPGLFFSNGDDWYKYRKALAPKMLRPQNILNYFDRLSPIADEAVEKIKRDLVKDHDKFNEIIGLDQLLFKWSFESSTDFLFSTKFNALSESPSKEAEDAIEAVGKFLTDLIEATAVNVRLLRYYAPKRYREFEQSILEMFKYAEKFMRNRLAIPTTNSTSEHETDDLVTYLLSHDGLSEIDIFASIVDVYFAGIDTTSNTMLWILYFLSKNINKQECLRNEIIKVVGDRKLKKEDLSHLPYLKAVIKESLRLRPVVPFLSRKVDVDMVLSGYHVPAGTPIGIALHVFGMSSKDFEDPSEFKPERWFTSRPTPFSHIPFGFGTRMCVGRRFAELELQLLLVRIIQTFSLSYKDGFNVGIKTRSIMTADQDVRVKFETL